MNLKNKELKLLDKAAKEFSRKQLFPEREKNDDYPFGPFFRGVVEKAFDLDFFHVILPEDMGGIGHGIEALCIVLDNICQEDSSLGGIIFTNAFSQEILISAGENDMLQNILSDPQKVEDFFIATPVLSNPSEIKCLPMAKKKNNKYYLSGELEYLVIGDLSGQALIPAIVEGEEHYSYFIVNMKDSNIKKSEPIFSHGLHSCPAIDISLENVEAGLVGKTSMGNEYFQKVSNKLQLAAAAMSCGIMKGSFNEAISYSKSRVQGGRKLTDWSEMQMMLSDMAIKMNVADILISRACEAVDNKEKNWDMYVQAASLHIQSSATELTTDGIQALGGVGYMKDFGQEKRFRDAGQVQCFLGMTPMKKIRFLKQIINN